MRLVEITPSHAEWQALDNAGAGGFLGERPGLRLWAICDPEPVGVMGFLPHETAPETAVSQIWVRPDRRGKWWTRNFYEMWLAMAFMPGTNVIHAEVDNDTACERMIRQLGWEKYCQSGNVSYYLLTKEEALGGKST